MGARMARIARRRKKYVCEEADVSQPRKRLAQGQHGHQQLDQQAGVAGGGGGGHLGGEQ